MSKTPLISVVIPVFNTGENCLKLLERLINSSYQNVEIICIDDGSKDNSYELLSDFAKQHSQVIVKKQKNAGPSAARNAGIELATGQYISFIDSDDYVSQDFLEKLLDAYDDKTLLACTALQYNRVAKGEAHNDFMTRVRARKKHEDIYSYVLYLMRIDGRMYGVINKLFRRDIIEKKKIRFDTSLDFAEDTKFVLDYTAAALPHFKHGCDIKFIYEPLYIYNYGTETSTVAKSSLDWKNWQQSYKNLKDWSKQQNNQRVRRRRHIIKARWRISHMLSVARANISRKEKLKYIDPLRLLIAEVLVKFRR